MDKPECPVLVTGFGPFHDHSVNASWATVQELEKLEILDADSQKISLVTKEIPVSYESVQSIIPDLVTQVSPKLCVHVGVSPYHTVVLERYGKNLLYTERDINGKQPEGQCGVVGGPDRLETTFDIPRVLEQLNIRQPDMQFRPSSDAGRFLCDFIYYTSLHLNSAPVLFVHVCTLNNPYSVEQLALALKNIIEILLAELESK